MRPSPRRLQSPGRKPGYATLRRLSALGVSDSLAASGNPGLAAQKCYPCARTNLLPMFPAVQRIRCLCLKIPNDIEGNRLNAVAIVEQDTDKGLEQEE